MLGWGRKWGLATRFSIRTLCVVYFACAAVGYVTYRVVYHAVRRNVEHQMASLADRKALQIEAALDEKKLRAVAISHAPEVARFLSDFSPPPTGMDPIEHRSRHAALRTALKDPTTYENRHAALRTALKRDAGPDADLFLLSRDGEFLFSMGRSIRFGATILGGPDTTLANVWARTHLLLQPQRSDFHYDPKTGAATAWVIVPVVSAQTLTGAVALQVRSHILNRVASDNAGLGQTDETIIVTAGATHPILLTPLHRTAGATSPMPSSSAYAFPLQESLSGKEGGDVGIDYRNQEVLARWRPLSIVGGGIVVKIDTHEAFAPVAKAKEILIWAGLIAPVLLIGLAVSLSRSVTRPLAQMARMTRDISLGRFPPAIEVGDEPAGELDDMITAFRAMATQIQTTYQEMEKKTQTLTQKVVALETARGNMQVEIVRLRSAEQMLHSINEALENRVIDWTQIAKKNADALSDSEAELDHFAHVASHDLQEPLRIISSYTQLLAKRYKGELDSDADQFIDYVVRGVNRMKQTIDDLVVYSQASAQTDMGAMTRFNASTAVEQALTHLQGSLSPTREAVVTYDPLPMIVADWAQIVQLFEHMVDNGLKFQNGKAPRLHISAEQIAGEWIFSVRDNGIGIEARYLEQIFTLFQRLHAQDKYPGTGIGLAVCKRIVLRHKGRIWVESRVGEGSTFKFTLPQTDLKASSTAKTV